MNIIKNLYRIHKLIKQIKNYIKLPNGWDGYGALTPKLIHIKYIIKLVKSFSFNYIHCKPMVNEKGLIGFYWDFPNIYIDLEIDIIKRKYEVNKELRSVFQIKFRGLL